MTASPLNLFAPAGAQAQQISGVLWGLIWLSVVVVVFITVAVLAGIVARNRGDREPAQAPVGRASDGLWWIYAGTGISTIVLVVFIGWTFATMAGSRLPGDPAFTVEVSARQWWWAFTYDNADPGQTFVTADELHIPVGRPVRFLLTSPDVIHSFWIPSLGGKTDVIPGRVNETWLEADKPGIYRGQCAEYCGQEHTQMALFVVAEPQVAFDAWRAKQAVPTPTAGPAVFTENCGKCHTVRGTAATGTAGPDLTHLMSRGTIAAGALDNTIGNLAGWIANPQGIKPGAKMPAVPLSGPDLQAVLHYLETLS